MQSPLLFIATKHLLARKRQSVVSLLGIILGTAFFLAISSLMQGSQRDFMTRLVDNSPHITLSDQFRNPRQQPVETLYQGAVELRNVKPVTETRGLRGFNQILDFIRSEKGVLASPVLMGQALITYAGQDTGVTLNGMIPSEIANVSTIQNYMIEGKVEALVADPNGVIVGAELTRILSLKLGDNIQIAAPNGQVRTFKILGIFRTGRLNYDQTEVFMGLKRAQALLGRANRANRIIVKMENPQQADSLSARIEREIGYKTVSWQESSADIRNTFATRNIIMYTVVSAVLVVASFGIYNVISTVVLEKQRDISILKSMGFYASDIKRIFVIQGTLLGLVGCLTGLPLGCFFMWLLMQLRIKPPGSTEAVQMPVAWDIEQFILASAFALASSILAALLPARKAATVQPVDILRGS